MDLLSVLLRARDRGEQTDENLRDELVTMLLAGHDTTALALTYTFYLLSNHPEARERVAREAAAATADGPPTAADAREMKFTERVLNESLRLYPPVYTLFREPKLDVKLGVPDPRGLRAHALTVGYPPLAAVVRRPGDVRSEPLGTRTPEQAPAIRLLPVRRRAAPLHREGVLAAGGEADPRRGLLAVRPRLRRGPDLSLRGSLTMHPDHPVPMRIRER